MRQRPGVLGPRALRVGSSGSVRAGVWACVKAGRWPHGCQIPERCCRLAARRLGTALSDTLACGRSGSGALEAGVRLPQLLPTPQVLAVKHRGHTEL